MGITAELKKATDSLAGITTDAAGGVASAVKNFGQAEIDQLGAAITTANSVVADVRSVLDRASGELSSEARKAVAAEISAARKAVGPFVAPLTGLADAALRVVGVRDLDTSQLDQAVGQISRTLQGLTDIIGLPGGINLPGITV